MWAVCLLFSAGVHAEVSSDSDKETARALVFEGDRAFAEHDFTRALARYSTAYRLVHVPTVGIEVARANAALGQLQQAQRVAQEVLALPAQSPEPQVIARARLDAAELERQLRERIPSLRLEVAPATADCQILIDGVEVSAGIRLRPVWLDPGRHVVRVGAAGYRAAEQQLVLVERERQVLTVALLPEHVAAPARAAVAPAAPLAAAGSGVPAGKSPLPVAAPTADAALAEEREPGQDSSVVTAPHTAAFVLLGTAAAGVAVGSVSGILAFHLKPDCPGDRCPKSRAGDLSNSKLAGNVATVSFGAALVLGAVGGLLLLRSAPEQGASAAAPRFDVEASSNGWTFRTSGSF